MNNPNVFRSMSNKMLKEIVENGDLFKAAAAKEISRRKKRS